jgi:hypothetical protein
VTERIDVPTTIREPGRIRRLDEPPSWAWGGRSSAYHRNQSSCYASTRPRLKPVQDLLGDHQDTTVSQPALRELAATQRERFTYGLVCAGARAERAEQDRLAAAGLGPAHRRRAQRCWPPLATSTVTPV